MAWLWDRAEGRQWICLPSPSCLGIFTWRRRGGRSRGRPSFLLLLLFSFGSWVPCGDLGWVSAAACFPDCRSDLPLRRDEILEAVQGLSARDSKGARNEDGKVHGHVKLPPTSVHEWLVFLRLFCESRIESGETNIVHDMGRLRSIWSHHFHNVHRPFRTEENQEASGFRRASSGMAST